MSLCFFLTHCARTYLIISCCLLLCRQHEANHLNCSLFFIMSNINNEALYEAYYEEVIEEARETETISMMDANDIHIATMNRFAGHSS